jgi:8-oxo-dGTP diphosphatase
MVMETRPYIGVAVIVMHNHRVLLGKRKGSHGAGGWQFPGGHLEFNETIERCARREVLEETGVHIQNIRYGPYTNDIFRSEKKHYVTLFVMADYKEGTAEVREPDKCEQWRWFEWGRFPEPLFLPTKHVLEIGFNPFASSDCGRHAQEK